MAECLNNYEKTGYEGVTDTWDLVQQNLQCCGVRNYTDWRYIDGWKDGRVPDSCCKVTFEGKKILKHLTFSGRIFRLWKCWFFSV